MADELEHKTITRAKLLSFRILREHTFPIFSTLPHIYENFLQDTETSFFVSYFQKNNSKYWVGN